MAVVMDSWRRQEATQQARRRDANESIEVSCTGTGRHPILDNAFLCECGDPRCVRTVYLSLVEYESVRAWPTHFLIAANHENPEVESVVSETDRFTVIATLTGEASKVALRTNPRPLYPTAKRPDECSGS
jgi:hypothetical protein